MTLQVVLRGRHLRRPAFRQRLVLVQRRYLRLGRLRRLRPSLVSVIYHALELGIWVTESFGPTLYFAFEEA